MRTTPQPTRETLVRAGNAECQIIQALNPDRQAQHVMQGWETISHSGQPFQIKKCLELLRDEHTRLAEQAIEEAASEHYQPQQDEDGLWFICNMWTTVKRQALGYPTRYIDRKECQFWCDRLNAEF